MKNYIVAISCSIFLFACNDKPKSETNQDYKPSDTTISTQTELSTDEQLRKAKEDVQLAFNELESAKSAIYVSNQEKEKAISDASRKYKLAKEFLLNLEKKVGKKADDVKEEVVTTTSGQKMSPESQKQYEKLRKKVEENKEKRDEIKVVKPSTAEKSSDNVLMNPAPREQ